MEQTLAELCPRVSQGRRLEPAELRRLLQDLAPPVVLHEDEVGVEEGEFLDVCRLVRPPTSDPVRGGGPSGPVAGPSFHVRLPALLGSGRRTVTPDGHTGVQ